MNLVEKDKNMNKFDRILNKSNRVFVSNRFYHFKKTLKHMLSDIQMFKALFTRGKEIKIWKVFFPLTKRK